MAPNITQTHIAVITHQGEAKHETGGVTRNDEPADRGGAKHIKCNKPGRKAPFTHGNRHRRNRRPAGRVRFCLAISSSLRMAAETDEAQK
jgi:hypothetical protein